MSYAQRKAHAMRFGTTRIPFVAVVIMLAGASLAPADVKLPAIIGSNMVLQSDMKLPIWGTADPGEAVTVTLG